ncbi:MAG: LLM class flavin-dependent oxidoreductase [Dehalococcoidia bacterium]|nr:LLM class flavin-dependent oxidoreductase [Dehalococcoidia bacterium]
MTGNPTEYRKHLGHNKLSLGLFGVNCSGGLAVTTVPERWEASWENNQSTAKMADQSGLDFMLPLGRWKGYGGITDHNASNFETLTWASGILASTINLMAFGTVHVSLFNPIVAAKQMVTADHIGHGRFGLNIVCGWNNDEFDMLGVGLPKHDKRYDQGQEWIDVISKVWTEDGPFDYEGDFYQVRKTEINPKPYGGGKPMIVAAGNSPRGREFAARNADMMFTNLRGDISEVAGNVAALRELASGYNRDIGVFSNVAIVCRPTKKEAEEYYRYYAIENADWDAVEILIEGRGLKKPGITEEALQAARIRAAGGNGALPIVGAPDDIVALMKRLYDGGVTALAMGFTNYLEHFPYFRDEVLPRLVREGLRADSTTKVL